MADMAERKRVFYARRAIFFLTALAVAIPLRAGFHLPMTVGWPAKHLYEAVENVPADKVIILSISWGAGYKGETQPQTEALLLHLAKTGKRFVIWSWSDMQGPELAQQSAERITQEYGRKYGIDWVNWGFKTGGSAMLRGWAEDIWGIIKEDRRGTPLKELPIMQNIHSQKDIGLIIDISSGAWSGTPTVLYYVQFLYGVYGTPIGYACTGVMAPEAFPYLDSHQLVGLLRGLAGAAEYEQLEGYQQLEGSPGPATMRMAAQSFAHILIIVLIILGNVIYFLDRRSKTKLQTEPKN
jgi:hypothetical protein